MKVNCDVTILRNAKKYPNGSLLFHFCSRKTKYTQGVPIQENIEWQGQRLFQYLLKKI